MPGIPPHAMDNLKAKFKSVFKKKGDTKPTEAAADKMATTTKPAEATAAPTTATTTAATSGAPAPAAATATESAVKPEVLVSTDAPAATTEAAKAETVVPGESFNALLLLPLHQLLRLPHLQLNLQFEDKCGSTKHDEGFDVYANMHLLQCMDSLGDNV
ncbi:hypothetical protein E4U19_002510 [Claviceps sp. Clav32 group G5]|nr:hypothetical protein E4U19_002510 [Claviceps sp. Clav32 group G5]KAG6049551.1 hypothetical protein E4U39_005926 [Claviceps sp. Clav50 group G5]